MMINFVSLLTIIHILIAAELIEVREEIKIKNLELKAQAEEISDVEYFTLEKFNVIFKLAKI